MGSKNLKKSVVVLTLLVAMGGVGFGEAYGYGGGNSGGGTRVKVDICHNGNTLNVSKSAVRAHLGHGDTEGACAATSAAVPKVLGASDSKVATPNQFSPFLVSISSIMTAVQTGNKSGDISNEDAAKFTTQLSQILAALMGMFK